MSAAVEVSGLRHSYPGGREALKGVSFTVAEGQAYGLLGPNGGGKTTLFKILSTFFPPTSGRASVFGKDVASLPLEVRRAIGVVFQNPSLDRKLSVRENMTYQGRLYGLSGADLARRVDAMLERYRLTDRAGELAEELSGGLKRRVELAKGLLHEPKLLLLDEPTAALDPGGRKDLWDHLLELRASRKVTILVTTHLMEEAEKCDRLAILDRGEIVAEGSPVELKSAIGGDVISIACKEPEKVAEGIKARFGLTASRLDSQLRLEKPSGHTFIPQLVEAFPGQIESVSVGKPTLEDAFIHHTGHRFWGERAE
jgi:ABC-2 type transport system ATP-binding protein